MSESIKSAVAFTKSEIDAAVAKIIKAGKAMSRGVEDVLVMAVYDSIVNESAAVANSLIGALRLSTKRDGIIAFLEKFGQLHDKGGKVGFVHFALGAQARLAWTTDYVDTVKEEAQSWESFKPAAPEKGAYDVVAELEKLLKAHSKCVADGRAVIDGELAEVLVRVKVAYAADKAIKAAMADGRVVAAPAKEAVNT